MRWNEDSSPVISKFLFLIYFISLGLAVARLAGFINWSWWVIFLPVWLSAAGVTAFVAGAAIIIFIAELVYLRDKNRWRQQMLREDTPAA